MSNPTTDSSVENLRDTIVPKSDQLNADQLIGTTMTITVTAVRRGNSDDQPVVIHFDGDNGRPFKPCKTMRKVLIYAWGDDGRDWVGRSMTLYTDPEVKFGGVKVGGIRISHLSHIERDEALSLASTRGKKETIVVRKLGQAPDAASWLPPHLATITAAADMAALQAAYIAAVNANKKLGDKRTMGLIVDAKDRRKAILSQPASAVVNEDTGEVI